MADDLVMMRCEPLNMRLSTKGCAKLFEAAQKNKTLAASDRGYACKFCPIGAANAGVAIASMGEVHTKLKMVCVRCEEGPGREKGAARMIGGNFCVGCYNRDREARIGANRRGTRPDLMNRLHDQVITVCRANGATIRRAERVAHRVESILTVAKQAHAWVAFGAPPLQPQPPGWQLEMGI